MENFEIYLNEPSNAVWYLIPGHFNFKTSEQECTSNVKVHPCSDIFGVDMNEEGGGEN